MGVHIVIHWTVGLGVGKFSVCVLCISHIFKIC